MKQLVQNLSNGFIEHKKVPVPRLEEGTVLIQTKKSLVSTGTERMLVDFAKSNYFQKALQQPEKVKDVFSKIKTDGLIPTIEAVNSKLKEPLPLGYCNVGEVIESSVPEFTTGDRVVSNGGHSEIVRVGKNLCAKIPDKVDYDSAAFTVLGSIALQSIRLAKPNIGERFVVFGLGTIGLLTVQILLANGCEVLAVDIDDSRCKLANEYGAKSVNPLKEDLIAFNDYFSNGLGSDGVIIAASSQSNLIIQQAANVCRKRGRVILVGVVGLDLRREDFYEKEISFQVSSSYGPGRYDPLYEEEGIDYPLGFVRWTENRNFQAVLQLIKSESINLKSLITSRYDFNDAAKAYENLSNKNEVGILLEYTDPFDHSESLIKTKNIIKSHNGPTIGLIGAGNFAYRVLIPSLNKLNVNKHTIVSSMGLSASESANKYSFSYASSSIDDVLDNPDINTVFIATRHNLHAKDVIRCLKKKKNVYVEKPLALNLQELDEIKDIYFQINPGEEENAKLMVGFNRRFSPHIDKIKLSLQASPSPISSILTVNAGKLEDTHWTNNLKIGGGRIIGEACHFIDLLTFIHDSRVKSFTCHTLESRHSSVQTITINLNMENGSIGSIHYFSNGGNSYPKERIEVFQDSSTLVVDNFRKTLGFNFPGFKNFRTFSQNKGHDASFSAFINAIQNGTASPISFEDLYHSSKTTIDISEEVNNQSSRAQI